MLFSYYEPFFSDFVRRKHEILQGHLWHVNIDFTGQYFFRNRQCRFVEWDLCTTLSFSNCFFFSFDNSGCCSDEAVQRWSCVLVSSACFVFTQSAGAVWHGHHHPGFKGKNTRIFISNTTTWGKLVIKCPRKPREDLWKSRGTFTNPPEAWGDI